MAISSNTQVRILDVTYIPLLQPPPPHLERVKLSLFDAWFTPVTPIQRLLFYEGADLPAFPSLLHSLRSSLAAAIARFFPVAGKLSYMPSSGDVVIDCSTHAVGPGVAFTVAEADGDLRRLAGDEAQDVPEFMRFIPRLEIAELPAPVLAVQVTRFSCGGVAIGVTLHHAVADGRAMWQFMDAWTAACRGVSPGAAAAKPTFDRTVIVHPRGEEVAREILRKMAPDLPLLPKLGNNAPESATWRHDTRTFVLDRDRIHELKNRISQLSQTAHGRRLLQPPSTFVAVAALAWTATVRARAVDAGDTVYLMFLGDCRERLRPPVGEGFFGNCVRGCFAEAVAGDLAGEAGLLRAASAIQEAIREFVERPFEGCDVWFERFMGLAARQSPLTYVSASPRFKVYDSAEFGWGKPSRVEFVVGKTWEGMVVVTGAREEGSVQMSASLKPAHMPEFKSQVLGL